jgi:hypothetical protein
MKLYFYLDAKVLKIIIIKNQCFISLLFDKNLYYLGKILIFKGI